MLNVQLKMFDSLIRWKSVCRVEEFEELFVKVVVTLRQCNHLDARLLSIWNRLSATFPQRNTLKLPKAFPVYNT